MKKIKEPVWFGCSNCGYRPDKDETMSNDNWSVYDCKKLCPKCSSKMKINIT